MARKPCVRGIRITVGTMTGLLAAGDRIDSALEAYPDLEPTGVVTRDPI
jgi:uncharacterized protein (DUF433 family)